MKEKTIKLMNLRSETIKRFFKQPTLYLGILIISSSAGCTSLGNREVTQVQPSPVEQTPNWQSNKNFIAEVVQEVGPAVVRIDATRTVEVPINSINPLIERFFGENIFPTQERVQRGVGSGFIISEDGRILTKVVLQKSRQQVLR